MNQLKIQKNILLAPFSSFKIGGRAKYFIRVKSSEELLKALQWAKSKKIKSKIFAGGTNLLFPDHNLNYLVIRFLGGKTTIKDNQITVEAGVLLSDLIQKSISEGLAGLERLAGIPGTIGGAIIGNAGAYGYAISEVVKKVEIWDGEKRRWLTKKDCHFEYRQSLFKGKPYQVLKVVLGFTKGNPQKLIQVYQDTLKDRQSKWRPNIYCAGCFFKNVLVKNLSSKSLSLINQSKIIEGKIPAGYLLDTVGAKKEKVGDIEVANFHANVLINKGGGKAKDVIKLAKILKEKVYQRFGIKLEEEVRYF